MCSELEALKHAVLSYCAGVDPASLSCERAGAAVVSCSQMEAALAALRALLAARAASGNAWRQKGFRSPVDELAHQAGISPTAAKRTLDTGRRLNEQPEVAEAALSGELSFEQTSIVSEGVAVNPAKSAELLEQARTGSVPELNEKLARIKAAASDPEQRRRRIHDRRYLRRWSDSEGALQAHLYGQIEDGTSIWRLLDPIRRRLHALRGEHGGRDPFEALDYDALVLMAEIAIGRDGELDLNDLLDLGLFPQLDPESLAARAANAGDPDTAPSDDDGCAARAADHQCVADHPAARFADRPAARDADRPAARDADRPGADPVVLGDAAGPSHRAGPGGPSAPAPPSATLSPRPPAPDDLACERRVAEAGALGHCSPEASDPHAAGRDTHEHGRGAPSDGAAARLVPRDERSGEAVAAAGWREVERRTASQRRRPKLAGSPTKVIVRVDLDTLLRGRALEGELCEIAGYGPVPVSVIEELVAHDNAFLVGVLTKSRQVLGVYHHRRRPSAHQISALEFLYPSCAVAGCNARAALQIDHREDWAQTHFTVFDLLDRLCPHHHRLKTDHGWGLVHGTGKRAFVPPDDARHPRHRARQGDTGGTASTGDADGADEPP